MLRFAQHDIITAEDGCATLTCKRATEKNKLKLELRTRTKKNRPPYMHESALFIRKWQVNHKRFFEISCGLTRSKNFLQKNYFCSKHNALFVRFR
jgi:hypothetical protein